MENKLGHKIVSQNTASDAEAELGMQLPVSPDLLYSSRISFINQWPNQRDSISRDLMRRARELGISDE
jgi:hypothetical protein